MTVRAAADAPEQSTVIDPGDLEQRMYPIRGTVPIASLVILSALPIAGPSQAEPLVWTSHGTVAEGNQFDAVRGPDDRIYLVSSRYYEFASDGALLTDEAVGDGHQGGLDFPPAIAVGGDGVVHLVTRHGGDFEEGNDIRYRRRNAAGGWDRDYLVGSRERRNYVVGVVEVGSRVIVAYSAAGDDVWGDVRLWDAGESSAAAVGDLGGIWRADDGIRMRSAPGRLFMVSGKPDPDGSAYLLHATGAGDVVSALASSAWEHRAGTGRRGFVDLAVDGLGQAHMIYGALQTAYYNRYDQAGQRVFGTDVLLGSGLGEWHMSAGLSAVGASDDGQSVVAVLLQSDGSQQAANSDLLWIFSLDGGVTWSAPADLGVNTDGGEGRQLPRIVTVGDDFLLFFTDVATGSIGLMTMYVEPDEDGDGYPSGVDCDDADPSVHPAADEVCDDGIDNDCDGFLDEDDPDCPDPGDDDDTPGDDDDSAPDDDDCAAADDDDDGLDDDDSTPDWVYDGCGCDASVTSGPPRATVWLVALLFTMLSRWGRHRD